MMPSRVRDAPGFCNHAGAYLDDGLDRLTPDNRAAVNGELRPGETVLWAAEPSPQMQLVGYMGWLVAIPAIGFGAFWSLASLGNMMAAGSISVGHIVFALFGLPFLIVGVIGFLQPWTMRRNVRRTVYALTSERLIRVVRGNPRRIDEVPLDAIGSVSRQVYSDGSGTLTIQTLAPASADGARYAASYSLMGVRDVEHGYQLLVDRTQA